MKRGPTAPLRLCANENDEVVAALVPPRSATKSTVVKVTNEAKSWTVRDHHGPFDATFTIRVTPNGCPSFL